MSKKILILGIAIVVIFTALATISCGTSENKTLANLSPEDIAGNLLTEDVAEKLSPEDVAENLLNDIFTISYDEYVQSSEHRKSLSIEEARKYIYRDDIFKDYFTEGRYQKFLGPRYNMIHRRQVLEDKFDIIVKSIDLDMRDTSDEDTKTCFFTIEYELIFLDEERESITMSTDGEMALAKESNTWLISFVLLRIRVLDFD